MGPRPGRDREALGRRGAAKEFIHAGDGISDQRGPRDTDVDGGHELLMNEVTKRWWLVASFGAPLALGLSAQSLKVRLDGDDLRVAAPQLKFLTGRSLERLKDGASVVFLAQLSLSFEVNAPAIKRAVDR